MAIDWSREITFSGLKKAPQRPNTDYPEKTYMNLMVRSAKTVDVRRTAIVAVVLVVIVALFLKFGVLDFYSRVDEKKAELDIHHQALNTLSAELVDYNAVLEEYEGYESMSLSEDGLSVDALKALAIVDRYIAPSARVTSIVLSGNTISLNLSDITLDGVGKLVSKLYDQDMVDNVSVSTAATHETASEDVTAAMTITLSAGEE